MPDHASDTPPTPPDVELGSGIEREPDLAAEPDLDVAPEWSPPPGEVTMRLCPDGPILVRGATRILTADGREIVPSRRTLALCRCGGSVIKPWCDGTHKHNGFSAT